MLRQTQELQPKTAVLEVFTPSAKTQRLLDCLSCWQNGWSLRQIAQKHDISHTRVRAILRDVGCDATLRMVADGERPRRRVPAERVKQAMAMLDHPRFVRLKHQQKSAIVWTALGLTSRQIAHRTGVTPQCVRAAFTTANFKLASHRQKPAGPPPPEEPAAAMPELCWDGLLQIDTSNL